MPFVKGKSGNPAGKPVGAKSEKTLLWEELHDLIVNAGAEAYKRHLMELAERDPEKFMERYEHILEYFKPKQARQDVTLETKEPINVIVKTAERAAE